MFQQRMLLIGCIRIAVLWLPFAVFGQSSPVMQDHPVIVESDPAKMETIYRITESSCQISWTVYHSQVNEGIIKHDSRCTFPLDKQLLLISKIFAKILEDERTSTKFHTLFLGSLNSSPEISARLAMLAKRSPHWDTQKGQPKSGGTNPFIVKLANQSHLYDEWEAMFQHFNRSIEISAVEKVLVSKAGEFPYFAQLKEQGIKATDKLPYDCLVWLSMTKKGESNSADR